MENIEFFVTDSEMKTLREMKQNRTWREFILGHVGLEFDHIQVGRPKATMDDIYEQTPHGAKQKEISETSMDDLYGQGWLKKKDDKK
jgi:hypothetical protein